MSSKMSEEDRRKCKFMQKFSPSENICRHCADCANVACCWLVKFSLSFFAYNCAAFSKGEWSCVWYLRRWTYRAPSEMLPMTRPNIRPSEIAASKPTSASHKQLITRSSDRREVQNDHVTIGRNLNHLVACCTALYWTPCVAYTYHT